MSNRVSPPFDKTLTGLILSQVQYVRSIIPAVNHKARDCKLYPAVPEAPEAPEDPQNPEAPVDPQNPEAPEDPKDEDPEISKYPEDCLDYF